MSDGKKETRETDGAQEASAASESDAKTPGPEDTIEDMEKRGLKGEETVVIGAEKGDARGLTEKEFVDRMEVKKSTDVVAEVDEPSLAVPEDERVEVDIDVYFSSLDGRLVAVGNNDIGGMEYLLEVPTVKMKTYHAEFTSPGYDRFMDYRRASNYVWQGQQLVDRLKLRNFLLLYHLVELDMPLRDEDGEVVEFVVNEKGEFPMLEEATASAIYRLRPMVLEMLLAIYERKAMLRF